MKNKRLLKTIVGLAIAFAMTFTPFSGSYAMLVNPAGNGDGQVTETQATDAASEEAVSEETEPSQPEVTTEESEPAEQAEPEIEENVEPVEEVAEKAERTEYIWKDEKVKVTAVLSDAEAIPDDAELVAKAVTSKSDDYDYDAYMEALNKNSDSKYNGKNTLLYDVAFMKDGVEIQPESGTVSVTFEFLDKQLSKSIGAKKASDVNVIHLPLKNKIRDKYDTTADAKNIDAKDIVFEELTKKDNELAVNVKNEKVQFETSEFSVYAYTVDFEYTDPETGKVYTYNLEGAGSITLKELAIILGITKKANADEFIDNVDNVTFSNENLVKVKKTLFRGWVLKSLAPFSSEELLTITMKDGTVIEVKVTDNQTLSDLTYFLKNMVITGATQNSQGRYEVEKGKEYNLIATFAESSAYQFANRETLTYQMPTGVTVLSRQTGSLTINIVYKGRTYQVDATYDLGTDGKLEIKFDQTDPDFPKLEESTNVSFRFSYDGAFDGSETEIKFNDAIERDVVFDDPQPGQAYANKTARFDESTGKFYYTITVRADGDVTNVNVKDVISGDALIFNNDVRVTGNSSSYRNNGASNGFDYTFASMHEGETITITYSASVDFSKDTNKDGKITADQTKNTVTVKPEDGPPHNSEYSREIDFKTTQKGNGTETGVTADGDKIIEWKIIYNQLALAPAAKDTITDKISSASAAYMKYYGDGLTIKVYNHAGQLVETRNVPYEQLTAHSDSSWTYTIPETDTTPYQYEITYKTVVDMKKVNQGGVVVSLDNDANGHHGGISVTPKELIGVDKEVESFTTEEVNWVSTLSIPEDGLAQAVVTDTLPSIWLNGSQHYDIYKDGSLQITGLLNGESYTVDTSQTGLVKITFYKDSGKTQTGLQGTPGGHQITVKLTTKVDQDWLNKGYQTGGYEQNHTNTIALNGKSDTATVTYGKPGVKKTGQFVSKDAQGRVSLKYTVVLSGVSSVPVSVADTFDTSLLEVDSSKVNAWDHMKIWGGNQYSQDAGRMPVNYTETANGIILTANTVPLQADGHYYPYYKIVYYLTTKEGVDLEQLAIANGGEYDLVNTAKWGDHESEFHYKTEYDYLDKELLNAGELGGTNRTAKYKITFNKAKATLNHGESMTMTDVMSSNLSVDYGSIQIVTDPAGQSVPYTLKGSDDGKTIATYTIPDSTTVVITYDAQVRGNGSQTITNKVSVNGKEEIIENIKSYGSAGEGQGAIASFKIVKVDGYDANKKLEGVRFKIFCENPDVNFGPHANGATQIILTTDENGEITLDGAEYDFYFNERYHVQEISPLDDYGQISFDYLVTLTNDMSRVDYGHYIYYYSDTMQIKNWPLEGLVVEKKVESDDQADKNRYYKFRLSILNEDGSVNTNYNEKNGDDQFENGVVEFELKDKEQKMFWGFWKGTKYKVEEIDDGGLATEIGYDVFDEEGNVIEHKTETAKSHTGELTQEDEVIVFKNTKHNEKGSLKLKKNVTVNGEATSGTLADGDYTFTIAGIGDNSSVSKTVVITIENGRTKSATIDGEAAQVGSDGYVEVKDLEPGDYTITETAPTNGASLEKAEGGKSVSANKVVTVTVVAGETADAVKAAGKASFTNNRTVEGKGEIKVQKVLNGREWKDDDQFKFTLSAADGTPMPSLREITITKADTDHIKSFGEITFTEAGEYTYTVKETKGNLAGVIYDETEHTVNIEVVDDGHGNLVAKNGDSLIKAVTITNTYSKAKGEVKVKKNLTGRAWTTNDSFFFTIVPVGNAPSFTPNTVEVTKDSTNYTESFGEVEFTQPGTYQWTVSETHKGETIDGVKYDSEDKTVTIEVERDADGKLVAKQGSNLIQTAEFENTYSKSGKGEVRAQKVLVGRDWTTADSFEFKITPVGDAPAFPNNTLTITSADASANYTKSFGEVTFTEPGTYQWTVSETHKGETIDGVSYESGDKTVTMVVVDNGKGELVADTGSALVQTAAFENTYSKSGKGEVKAKKVLTGRDWTTADSFEFKITPVGDAPAFPNNTLTITSADASANYTKSFGEVTFTEPGTYQWTVSETHKGETIDGVSYESGDKTVTIKVKDNGKGELVADTDSNLIQTAAFENTYSKSGKGEVKAKKVLTGRDWTTADSFEFKITPVGDAPAFPNNTLTITSADASANYTKSFGEVTFTEPGTYQWTVSETHKGETIDGVSYESGDKTVTIVVKDNGKGKLVAEEGSNLVQTAAFTNTYSKSGKGEVKAKKTLTGRDWTTADSFEFTITPVGNAPAFANNTLTITSADASANYTKSFGEVTFTEAGTYQWTVSETHKGETIDGVSYESADKTVTIKVKDNGKGELVADTDSALVQTAEFENTYSKSGKGEVKVKKTLTGKAWDTADSFEFKIKPVGDAPAFANNTLTITSADASANYTKSFGEVTFTKEGTYQWTVSETHKGETIDGVSYETADKTVTIKVKDNGKGKLVAEEGSNLVQTAEFENTYSKSGKGEVKVQKTLIGRAWTTADSFEFTITPVGNAPAFANNTLTITSADASTNYTKSFGEVTFTEAGTYQWTVSETHKGETIDGVSYESGDKTVTIKVKDNGKGKLVAEEDSALIQTAAFENTYSKSGKGEVKVQKNLVGREWNTDDSFKFTIKPVGDAPAFADNTVTVTKDSANYTESFGEVTFTEAGTYQWTVSEKHQGETIDGVSYETADKTVTIVVVDDGKGHLVADTDSALVQTAPFTNNYSASGKGEVKVKKTLNGRPWTTNDSFEFTITPESENAPAFTPNTLTITSADASTNYTKSFGEVEFTKAGTYTWTVTETHKSETIKGVTYDSTDKTVTIKVRDNGKGKLVADTDSDLIQTATFTNTYDAKGSIPLKGTKTFKYGSFDKEFTFSVYNEADYNLAIRRDNILPERDRNDSEFVGALQNKKLLTATTSGAQVGADGTATFNFKTADGKDLEYTLADISIGNGGQPVNGHLTKDFYYVIVEDIPAGAVKKTVDGVTFYYDSVNDIKYDATEYHVTITVTDKGDGTLDVRTSEGKEGPLTFGFINEKIYTKLLLTKDIDKYVTGDTKGELTNVTCVFKVKYKDPILGRTVTRTVSVQFDAQHVSAETAEVDKIPIEDPDKTFQVIEVYSIDYAGKVKQGKELKRVDQATGLPIWTVAFENEKEDNITGSGVINKVEKGDDNKFHITNRRDRTSEYPSPMPQGND